MSLTSRSQEDTFTRSYAELLKKTQTGRKLNGTTLLVEPISQREREVLRLIAAGLSNQEIADALAISVNTVKRHAYNIYSKLGVKRRTQAIAQAISLALL